MWIAVMLPLSRNFTRHVAVCSVLFHLCDDYNSIRDSQQLIKGFTSSPVSWQKWIVIFLGTHLGASVGFSRVSSCQSASSNAPDYTQVLIRLSYIEFIVLIKSSGRMKVGIGELGDHMEHFCSIAKTSEKCIDVLHRTCDTRGPQVFPDYSRT